MNNYNPFINNMNQEQNNAIPFNNVSYFNNNQNYGYNNGINGPQRVFADYISRSISNSVLHALYNNIHRDNNNNFIQHNSKIIINQKKIFTN